LIVDLFGLICIRVILLIVLSVDACTVVNQLFAKIDIGSVGVHLDAFELLRFPDALLLSMFFLAASLLLIVSLLVGGTLFLVFASLLIAGLALREVLILAFFALLEGLLGLVEPNDVFDEFLLNLVLDHRFVVFLFCLVFFSF
jgi:hypothetical protein